MSLNFQHLGLIQKAKPLIDNFRSEHPKFTPFLNAVYQNALRKDGILEITATSPEGKAFTTNLKLTDNDMELLQLLKELRGNGSL